MDRTQSDIQRSHGPGGFYREALEAAAGSWMQMQSTGIDLSAVIASACRYLGIEEKELARPTRRVEIARALSLVSYPNSCINNKAKCS
jgi:hypothetical protein